jgi:TATA-binding protein-associated factor Taf7
LICCFVFGDFRDLFSTFEGRVSVYRDEEGGLFVHTYGLSTAFGFATANGFTSFLSRTKIGRVENSDLKNHLRAKGAVRFLDDSGITELLDARLDGEDLAIVNADLERAREGSADREIAQEHSADFCGPSASNERDHYKDDEDDEDDEIDTADSATRSHSCTS